MKKLLAPLICLGISFLMLLWPLMAGASDFSNAWDSGKVGWGEITLGLGILFGIANVITRLTPTSKDDKWLNGIKEATSALLPGAMKFIPDRKKNP